MVNDYYLRGIHEITVPQDIDITDDIEIYKVCHDSTVATIRNIQKSDIVAIESDFIKKGEVITKYEIGLPGMDVAEIKFPFIIDNKWSDSTPITFCISYQELFGTKT